MTEGQYISVAEELHKISPCNFLVFGLGQDAFLWKQINENGRTLFLEDDSEWISNFQDSDLEIETVIYDTKAEDHKTIGFNEKLLNMEISENVGKISWDMILVDGPLGHNPPRPYKGPGRMQSIYTAHKLLKKGGICVVDDFGRLIEKIYSNHFFGKENLYKVSENKVAFFVK